jgi:hypothetical protein
MGYSLLGLKLAEPFRAFNKRINSVKEEAEALGSKT